MLITGLTSVKKAGGHMVLANITNIRTLLVITHLVQVFDCYEGVEEAMQGVGVTA